MRNGLRWARSSNSVYGEHRNRSLHRIVAILAAGLVALASGGGLASGGSRSTRIAADAGSGVSPVAGGRVVILLRDQLELRAAQRHLAHLQRHLRQQAS
jgi:hypothetical protein